MKSIILFAALTLTLQASPWPKPKGEFYHAATQGERIERISSHVAGGRIIKLVLPTGSMSPWLKGGEMAVYRAYKGERLEAGTVIDFDRGDHPSVTHMVVEDKGASLYVTGINNRWSDGWVSKSKVRGVLIEVITGPK